MTSGLFGVTGAVAVALWLAAYRLPFGDPARRRRAALWLADRSGLSPDPAFAVFATVLYLVLGLLVVVAMYPFSGLQVGDLTGTPSVGAAAALVLAVAGTSSLNSLCISILYRVRPGIDVPGEIADIQWISSILSLPRRARWIVPAVAAGVEEVVFRGLVFAGMLSLGAEFWVASVASTALFVVGQVVLVSSPVQAIVMAISSAILGTVGTLLVAGTGSLLPAVILHMSFAAFYTSMSASGAGRTTIGKVML